ncbi:histidine kinase [Roseivirga sp. UBA1976]|uniref:sensor histidine kinase n=1 Tax=Roseivirga sp. UBA1976 TaxID=1947386 RepID=UPI00258012B0|nr:histidine kinase [Roseivirga sp. UBA1976]MEC7755354.1 histidine kinase [Bacteroidota bacterium]|tara:strand:+ start:857 stop:2011 length:1155 start_codon:yes stop_codon:yes gene_type:complete
MLGLNFHETFLVLTSVLACAVLFNLTLYFGYRRQITYLFFAAYCAFHMLKVGLKTLPPEELLILGLKASDCIYISVILGLFSLNLFLGYYHRLSNLRWWALGFLSFSAIAYGWLSEDLFLVAGIVIAILQTARYTKKEPSSILFLLGLIMLLAFTLLALANLVPFGYFIGTIVMVLMMMAASGMRLSKQTLDYQMAQRKSVELENHLLRKSIQPHFILNSLTSLQELIESHPQKAGEFVQHLSEEFSFFSKLSQQRMVSVQEELQLIEAHLGIMSTRLNKVFRTRIENISVEDELPPGILLTLVENGITHGYSSKQEGLFVIRKEEKESSIDFVVHNDGEAPESVREGLGLQYVRSRLTEVYKRFELKHEWNNFGFSTRISLPK